MAKQDALLTLIDRTVGLYSTSPTCYLSALARTDDFDLDMMRRALEVDRTLIRVRAMRRSVYMFTAEKLEIVLSAMKDTVLKPYGSMSRHIPGDYGQLSNAVEDSLSDCPLTSAEIRNLVDPKKELGSGFQILLGRMASECRIVRAVSSGGWRSDRFSYALWKDWIPDLDPDAWDQDAARVRLAESYVCAYGPVELDDLQWWTGWTRTIAKKTAGNVDLNRTGTEIELLSGVRLLPCWDVLMVAYKDRSRLFEDSWAPYLYDKMGNATSVVLQDGRVVGVWDLGRSDDPLDVRAVPLVKWPKRLWKEVENQVERIGELIGSKDVRLTRCDTPTNLHESTKNKFMYPLG